MRSFLYFCLIELLDEPLGLHHFSTCDFLGLEGSFHGTIKDSLQTHDNNGHILQEESSEQIFLEVNPNTVDFRECLIDDFTDLVDSIYFLKFEKFPQFLLAPDATVHEHLQELVLDELHIVVDGIDAFLLLADGIEEFIVFLGKFPKPIIVEEVHDELQILHPLDGLVHVELSFGDILLQFEDVGPFGVGDTLQQIGGCLPDELHVKLHHFMIDCRVIDGEFHGPCQSILILHEHFGVTDDVILLGNHMLLFVFKGLCHLHGFKWFSASQVVLQLI